MQNVSADVTINGQTTFVTSSAKIPANYTAITVHSIAIDPNGITVKFTSADVGRKYQFSSPSLNPIFVQWRSINSTAIVFNVLSKGLNDAIGTVTGSQLFDAIVDGVSGQYTYTTLNQININAGKYIQLLFSAIGGGNPAGGGAGSGLQIPTTPQQVTQTLQNIVFSLTQKVHRLDLGSIITDGLPLLWNSPLDLTVNTITTGDTPISIVFQDAPLLLKGSPDGASEGKLAYTIRVPTRLCDAGITNNCVEAKLYKIPVTIEATIGTQSTLVQTSQIQIDLSKNLDPVYAIITVFVATGTLGIVGIAKRQSGKSSKHNTKTPISNFVKEHSKPAKTRKSAK